MSGTRLAFCDYDVLRRWIESELATLFRRRLRPQSQTEVNTAAAWLSSIQREGAKPATTVSIAGLVVTHVYKGFLPYVGEVRGFPLRKTYAQGAIGLIRRTLRLFAPGILHFNRADELWYTLCQQGVKEAYAQFGDYIDAAFIMEPPDGFNVIYALSGHGHLKYILEKSRFLRCLCLVV